MWTVVVHSMLRNGKANPHLHLMYSDRRHDGIERAPKLYFKVYKPQQPELGGCYKPKINDMRGAPHKAKRAELCDVLGRCIDNELEYEERQRQIARRARAAVG